MSNFTTLIPVQLRYVHHFRIFTYLIAASLKRLQSVCQKYTSSEAYSGLFSLNILFTFLLFC